MRLSLLIGFPVEYSQTPLASHRWQCSFLTFLPRLGPVPGEPGIFFTSKRLHETFLCRRVEECPLWVKSRHLRHKKQCPLYHPKADMCGATRNVSFVPIADIDISIRSPRQRGAATSLEF
jgi:hypothetical protein